MIDAPANQHGAATTPATHPIPRPQLEPPVTLLGAYRVYECLGTGGYASVYRARRVVDADPGDVALKRLHPHLMSDDDAVRAFGREARLAYLLDHPTIRRVYSLAREPGALFLTMEYIDGVSVFDLLRRASAARRHLPLSGILTLLHRLCDALHYAHGIVDELGAPAGFVHRDVSPSNLMIAARGRLKLIDMGVAIARIDEHTSDGRSFKVQGKYGYMAPEVLLREAFDCRADVFSVGVVAWELLTLCRLYPVSKPPFDVTLVRSRAIKAPSSFNRDCPPELDLIVMRALARDPAARWPSCAALADALSLVARRMNAPLSDDAVASLVEAVDDPVPRLARGTTPPSAAALAPAPDDAPAPAPADAPAPEVRPSRRRRRALAGLTAGVAVLLAAGITRHVVLPRPAPHIAVAPIPPSPPRALHPSPAPPAPRPPPAPPAPRPPPRPPVRLEGAPPRSWSAAYPYRARLCVDTRGSVSSVAILEGPSRLQGRITRALRRWRYAPVDRPTCFDVDANVEKVAGR
ncbi:MAG TPA: serine/threonine-protein kinase [Kofleriaceae bacterium]|nr:serine/threonine-protein kinase [Kofleriaceae bacterium]